MDWEQRLQEVNQQDSKVVIAYLHPGEVAQSFHGSLIDTLAFDRVARFTDPEGRFSVINSFAGGNGLVRGRNDAAATFLDGHPHADLLMFIDADMGWDPDAVEFLAQTMDATDVPILGGLCFSADLVPPIPGGQRAHEFDLFPTLYSWNEKRAGFDTRYDYPPDQLVEIGATGAAFVMIHRRVLEAIRAAEGPEWFTPVRVEGHDLPFGEDMSFCMRARKLGYPTYVHTGVKTSHLKKFWITESTFKDLRGPSASAVTAVVPVKDNLKMTRDLIAQLVREGGVTDILIFDNGSSDPEMVEWLEAVHEQGVASVFDASEAEGIHKMWNAGIDEAINRHHGLADIVFLNNDVALGPRCIRRLISGLRSTPGLMAACPNYDGRPGSGVTALRGICANRYDFTGGLAGFAFALRAEWIASGYRFPEEMRFWYGDNDLCLSIEKASCWYGMVHDSQVMHLEGGSQTETPECWDDIIAADREAFEAKWPTVELVSA